jgi:hypothetical protein
MGTTRTFPFAFFVLCTLISIALGAPLIALGDTASVTNVIDVHADTGNQHGGGSTGEARGSASIHTTVNGEVVTDIHKEQSAEGDVHIVVENEVATSVPALGEHGTPNSRTAVFLELVRLLESLKQLLAYVYGTH